MARPTPLSTSIASIACAFAFTSVSNAVDFDWTGTVDSNWLTPGNWNPAGPPSGGAGNFAYIRNGGTATIDADVPAVQDWFIGRAAGAGTVNHTAGTASNTGWTFIGTEGGTGTYNLTGVGGGLGSGSLSTGRIYLGGIRDQAGGTGTMRMNTSGTLTMTSDFAVSTRGGNGTFTLDAGRVVANSWMIVGETHNDVGGGTGSVIQNGGILEVGLVDTGGRLWLGSQEGTASTVRSTGNYTLNNGTLTSQEIVVGRHYDGTFTQNAGATSVVKGLTIGEVAGSIGAFNLSGGTVDVATSTAANFAFNAGLNGTANLTLSGGTFRQATVPNADDQGSWNQFAANGGSTANVNLSGTASISLDSRTFLGRNGTATFNQTGGVLEVRRGEVNIADAGTSVYNLSGGTLRTLNVDSLMTVGQWDNGNGTVNVSGTGNLEVAGRLVVAAGQDPVTTTGKIVQTGGTVSSGRSLIVGDSDLAVGTYNLDAGTVAFALAPVTGDVANGAFILGNRGNGTVNMTGGSFRQADVANVENGGNWNHIGQNNSATGDFNLSGGIVSFDTRTHIGSGTGSVGTVDQTGGTFEVRRHELIIGDAGTATYNISGGTLQTFGTRPIAVGNWNNANANLNISDTATVIAAGNLGIGQAENSTFASLGIVTQTGGTLTVGGDILMGNNSTQASGTFNLNGGVLDLTGGNVLRGIGTSDFNMTSGILRNVSSIIGDSLDGTFTQQGGVFEIGSVAGAGSNSTINGNFSLLAAGTLTFDITTGIVDQLLVNGTLTLAGSLDLDIGGVLADGSFFTLIANDGVDPVVGTFTNAPNGVTFVQAGNPYTVFYNSGDGNDVTIVPEPASASLIAVALVSYGLLGRRRRRE